MDVEQFGQYRLERMIGRGGMGEVFRAYDTVRGRVVALKRLPVHLATDATFQARFRRESALAARLSEPHIIPIHDFGEIDGQLYIDMRLVDGRDLGEVLAEHGPLTPARAVAVVTQVAGALDAAHADGLVHRDIKPSNVLITGEAGREFVYLVDFGIARSVAEAGEAQLTSTGATVGTVAYMAPERFLGTGSDHRVDVYSLACLLFEALTGRKPYGGDGLPAMIHAHLNMDPPSPSRERPTVPVALDDVVATGMAKKPADRYASAGALANAALAALEGGEAAEATTVTTHRPPPTLPDNGHPHTGRVGQHAPRPDPRRQHPDARQPSPGAELPPSRTMVELPAAGFVPPAGSGGPTAPRPRWRLVVAAVLAVAVVVAGVAVVAPLLSGRAGGPPAESTTDPSTAENTSEDDPSDGGGPDPLSDGDPTADRELWDLVKGNHPLVDGCEYVPPAGGTIRSALSCNAADPTLGKGLQFELHPSAAEAKESIEARAVELSGDSGTCADGGRYTGEEQASRYAACGFLSVDNSDRYLIAWTEPVLPIVAIAADDDPSVVWEWFSAHDPF